MKASFFAKILLFGEYGIIKESMGLSIPYRSFSGVLHVTTGELNASEHASNVSLKAFADYLRGLHRSGQALAPLDLEMPPRGGHVCQGEQCNIRKILSKNGRGESQRGGRVDSGGG